MVNDMKKILNKAIVDSQINTLGIFEKFTDFQNIMLSDISLIELLWQGEELNLKNKTIGELYLENKILDDNLEYENITFSGNEMLEMTIEENWYKYRPLVLGKLVRYGFSDIKIIEKISGSNGFDVFVLEDKNENIMVYFPCTNLVEIEDYLYDSYPVIDSLTKKGRFIGNITKTKKIFNSQQKQAKQILLKYLHECENKVHVSGFSLGGSLAEYSYLNCYKEYSNKLGNIILFNPFHNRLNEEEINILINSNKLKLYVCEGDSVSTVFNYNDFKNIAKTVYIGYHDNFFNTVSSIDNKESLLNLVANNIKNKYCNSIINICTNIKKKPLFKFSYILKTSIRKLERLKLQDIDVINIIQKIKPIIQKISPKLKRFGYDLENDYNLEFLENLHYIEIIFTSTHLTYTVDSNKLISFDKNGKVKKRIKINDKLYNVKYPSFDETSIELFGSNPYKEISNLVADIEK